MTISVQLDSIKRYTSRGDKKRALMGYIELYRNKFGPKEARRNAAYTIANLFNQLGNVEMTDRWTKKNA